jgi:ketosteroid isomerase-like protein
MRMKIRTLLLIIASLAVYVLTFAAPQNNPDTVSSKILALEADDFIITVEGSTLSKAGYIAHNGDSSVHVGVSDMSDLKVRLHGNTAVVTGAYHEKGTEKGKPYEYRDRFTDVWMNIKGTWQVIASHYSTPVR